MVYLLIRPGVVVWGVWLDRQSVLAVPDRSCLGKAESEQIIDQSSLVPKGRTVRSSASIHVHRHDPSGTGICSIH